MTDTKTIPDALAELLAAWDRSATKLSQFACQELGNAIHNARAALAGGAAQGGVPPTFAMGDRVRTGDGHEGVITSINPDKDRAYSVHIGKGRGDAYGYWELTLATPPAVAPAERTGLSERWLIVRESVLDVGLGDDVRTGGRPELGYAVIARAATYATEDEARAALKASNLPLGWVLMPLSRFLPDLGVGAARASAGPDAERDAARYRFIRDADRSDEALGFDQIMCYAMESLDAAIDAAMGQASAAAPAPTEQTCDWCHGSGQGSAMEGRGPDTYEVPIICEKCGGSGVLAAPPATDVRAEEVAGEPVLYYKATTDASGLYRQSTSVQVAVEDQAVPVPVGAAHCEPSQAALTFEAWLRTVCLQKPTAEAYDLARDAWKAAIAASGGAA